MTLSVSAQSRSRLCLALRYGQGAWQGVKAAYDAYTTAAEQDRAPEPTPPHFATRPADEAPTDVCYWLLEPQVHQEQAAGGSMSAATAQSLVARALAPGSMTPDPLNLLPPWRLLCLLQAVQALAGDHAHAGVRAWCCAWLLSSRPALHVYTPAPVCPSP